MICFIINISLSRSPTPSLPSATMRTTTGPPVSSRLQRSGKRGNVVFLTLEIRHVRNILGTRNLSEILSDREAIADGMHYNLEVATDPWGVHVERVEIKDVRLPLQLQRVMAAEAEATREARAKVVAAEGEQKSSRALREAADTISQSPAALQLRYLQVRPVRERSD